jgi:hypothetical protein
MISRARLQVMFSARNLSDVGSQIIHQYGNKSHPLQAMRPTAELVMDPIAVALSAWLSNFLFLALTLRGAYHR